MKTITVESLSDASNYAVIQLPERKFPSLLIQGDSLKSMASLAEEIEELAKNGDVDNLLAAVQEMKRQLSSRVEHYESVLAQEHRPLPYTALKKTN